MQAENSLEERKATAYQGKLSSNRRWRRTRAIASGSNFPTVQQPPSRQSNRDAVVISSSKQRRLPWLGKPFVARRKGKKIMAEVGFGGSRGGKPPPVPAAAADDSLWSPEHDWILQFDRLLSPKTRKASASLASTPTAMPNGNTHGDWRGNFQPGIRKKLILPPSFLSLSPHTNLTQRYSRTSKS